MRVLLDDQAVSLEVPTFAAAMDAGRREAERRGRVLVEVQVDGRPAPEAWLNAPESEDCRAAEVRLVSADPVSLVQVTLQEVADALEASRSSQKRAAELIQEDRLDEAMEPLSQAVSAWASVHQGVSNGAALLGLDTAALTAVTGEPIGAMIEDLAAQLRSLKLAIAGEDWTTVADVLGYDMDDRCISWARAIRSLAANIGQGRG